MGTGSRCRTPSRSDTGTEARQLPWRRSQAGAGRRSGHLSRRLSRAGRDPAQGCSAGRSSRLAVARRTFWMASLGGWYRPEPTTHRTVRTLPWRRQRFRSIRPLGWCRQQPAMSTACRRAAHTYRRRDRGSLRAQRARRSHEARRWAGDRVRLRPVSPRAVGRLVGRRAAEAVLVPDQLHHRGWGAARQQVQRALVGRIAVLDPKLRALRLVSDTTLTHCSHAQRMIACYHSSDSQEDEARRTPPGASRGTSSRPS
jgi:hypothetical protein